MTNFLEKYSLKKTLGDVAGAIYSIYDWSQQRLWPVYSAAMVVCAFHMIAVASEKQILADHWYGAAHPTLEADKACLVADSKKYFNEEVTLAVKEKVWQMPERIFKREYADPMCR